MLTRGCWEYRRSRNCNLDLIDVQAEQVLVIQGSKDFKQKVRKEAHSFREKNIRSPNRKARSKVAWSATRGLGAAEALGAELKLGRVDTFGEDVGKHLGVRDGVDHAVAVKYDPTEVMEPAEEVLSAFGGAAFLRKVFDGRAVDEVPNRARDIVAKEAKKL